MPTVALFVPCFVDQFRPAAAIAAVQVLERLGFTVQVIAAATCCGQPPTNAGLHAEGHALTTQWVDAHAALPPDVPIVVLSGSCALHLRQHAGDAARPARVQEFTAFLHDVVGLDAVVTLPARGNARVAVHVGCHARRGLGLAPASELPHAGPHKLIAILAQVPGLDIVPLTRDDECCGFGGTFVLSEPAVSLRMGRDRLRAIRAARVDAVVTTDLSCTLHLGSIADAEHAPMPMWHVAEVLAGTADGGARA